MKRSAQIKSFLQWRSQAIICVLIFCASLFIYLANDQMISSDDSVANSLIAFNWLQNHTLHLDAFRSGSYYMPSDLFGEDGRPYFFTEAPNGHLTSSYPIGTTIVSFPIYSAFFLYLKLTAIVQSGFSDFSFHLDITAPEFEAQRQFYEKLAGAILAAASNMIFYLTVRLNFGYAVAIFSTFVYGFATLNWAISSQGLWTHTVTNFLTVGVMLCLFKVNRSTGNRRKVLLIVAGILCGLFQSVRPTSLVFAAAIVVYSVYVYRRESIFLFIGATSALLNIAWNVYYFGLSLGSLIVGGYSSLLNDSGGRSGDYVLTWDYAKRAFLGLLISPSRGILVYSPVLLFAIPGVLYLFRQQLFRRQLFRRRSNPDETLILCLSIACLILFLQYCIFLPWWGAISFGSRFLVDILPVMGYLICYFLANHFSAVWTQQKRLFSIAFTLFLAALIFSTSVEMVGAFSEPHIWDTCPANQRDRLWNVQDSQIERQARNLLFRIRPPIRSPKVYLNNLNGEILQVKGKDGSALNGTITAQPSQQVWFNLDLKNTGRRPWFGCDTGLVEGRIAVGTRFLDAAGQEVPVFKSLIHMQGKARRGDIADAIGAIWFPQQPGTYQIIFSLRAERIGLFPGRAGQSAHTLEAIVQEPN